MTKPQNRDKRELRKYFRGKREALSVQARVKADQAICDNLSRLMDDKKYGLVAGYMTDGTEPNLRMFFERLLKSGKRLCFPRSSPTATTGGYEMVEITDLDKDFISGPHDIPEPCQILPAMELQDLTLSFWLVPGVAFDRSGTRLGRGKAVYDTFLRKVTGMKVGVFYHCQEAESLPSDSHDIPMNVVITEKEIINLI